jgi:hypothetical protein
VSTKWVHGSTGRTGGASPGDSLRAASGPEGKKDAPAALVTRPKQRTDTCPTTPRKRDLIPFCRSVLARDSPSGGAFLHSIDIYLEDTRSITPVRTSPVSVYKKGAPQSGAP